MRVLPRPWAAGRRSLYLRIPLTEVTGRRLGDGWDLEETLPVASGPLTRVTPTRVHATLRP